MDKEQAKFILQSFRPDGADAADADFAEALQLAVEDRELGEWLADERAADSAFASALCEVEIPEELRQHILAVMRGEKLADPERDQVMDDLLFGAMDDVEPPAGLRDQILAAMEMQTGQTGQTGQTVQSGQLDDSNQLEQAVSSEVDDSTNVIALKPGQTGWFRGWTRMVAVAAAVVLGAFMAYQMTIPSSSGKLITSHDVQQEAGQMLNASFELDVKGSDSQAMNTWLVSHQLPAPSNLPERFESMERLGCKEVRLSGGKKATLICFRENSGNMVHLIIIKNEYVKDRNLPTFAEIEKKDCYHCTATKWNFARWQDADNTFILLAKKEASKKDELLQYF